jgi:hypothetical protein
MVSSLVREKHKSVSPDDVLIFPAYYYIDSYITSTNHLNKAPVSPGVGMFWYFGGQ